MVLQFPPWRHDSELAMVRDWFFPDHAKRDVFSGSPQDMKQRAIDTVNLWLFKAGQLPPAIVATANLTEASLHDDPVRRSGGISDSAMQSIYAMAFARFVNGFVDRDVARLHTAEMAVDDDEGEDGAVPAAKGESSMYAHAATIGMPQNFVDLRHQLAHGDIPNLSYLRKMTRQALTWLWERWWVKNATGDPGRSLRHLEERSRRAREAADVGTSKAEAVEEVVTHLNTVEASENEPRASVTDMRVDGVGTQRPATAQKRKRGVLDGNDM